MNNDQLFEESTKIITEIISVIKEQIKLREVKYGNMQKITDIRQGIVKRRGIYLPFNTVEHKILFDGYEISLLEVFQSLYLSIFQEIEGITSELCLRTLNELSFRKVQILFGQNINQDEKNKYKFLILLADYCHLGMVNKKYEQHYKDLYKEFQGLLTDKQKEIIIKAIRHFDKKEQTKNKSLIKKLRSLSSSVQAYLYSKTKILDIFRQEWIDTMYDEWSHMLHGNLLQLKEVSSSNRPPNRHRLRVTWCLFLTGINVINLVSRNKITLETGSRVRKINDEFNSIKNYIGNNWPAIEQGN